MLNTLLLNTLDSNSYLYYISRKQKITVISKGLFMARITDREFQILNWIKENPLISQEELASLAGISRSSVSVHVSNLMKKGVIVGKGYVLQEQPYICVIGAAFVDIIGTPRAPLLKGESTPGAVETALGGVGRNQAVNMKLLGLNVRLISALGEDVYATKIKDNCHALNIDITESITIQNGTTPTFLSILTPEGKVYLGISAIEMFDRLTPEFISSRERTINQAKVCVTETNLCESSLEELAKICKVPIFAETISVAKAGRLSKILSRIHTLKTTRAELEVLLKMPIQTRQDLKQAGDQLLAFGMKRLFVTLDNSVYVRSQEEQIFLDYFPTHVVNRTGEHDSFMAALVWAYVNDFDLTDAALAGVAAASICFESNNAVNESLSVMKIQEYILRFAKDRFGNVSI